MGNHAHTLELCAVPWGLPSSGLSAHLCLSGGGKSAKDPGDSAGQDPDWGNSGPTPSPAPQWLWLLSGKRELRLGCGEFMSKASGTASQKDHEVRRGYNEGHRPRLCCYGAISGTRRRKVTPSCSRARYQLYLIPGVWHPQ